MASALQFISGVPRPLEARDTKVSRRLRPPCVDRGKIPIHARRGLAQSAARRASRRRLRRMLIAPAHDQAESFALEPADLAGSVTVVFTRNVPRGAICT